MRPLIFHVRDFRRTWFVIGDSWHILRGMAHEGEAEVRDRWEQLYGKPSGGYRRMKGLVTVAQVAAKLTAVILDRGSK